MRSLWSPRREGMMSPGERFLVYAIWGLIFFSWLPRSPVQPIGSPKEAPPVIFVVVLFALLGFAAELRWFWRALLGAAIGAPRILVYIAHGAMPANDAAGILFMLMQPAAILLVISFADPAPSLRRWFLSAPAGADRIARAAVYYSWAAVCVILVLSAALSMIVAARASYDLIQLWGHPVATNTASYNYLDSNYAINEAMNRFISASVTSFLLFSAIFIRFWMRALRRVWSKSA
jgi:hypothetical protein